MKLQVRVTPSSKPKMPKLAAANAKGRKKKDQSIQETGVAAARNDYPLSTNVPSPTTGPSRRRRARRMFDEANDEGDDTREMHTNGYAKDDFVVSDGGEESEAFEPPRIAGIKRNSARRQLSAPIKSDATMDSLSPTHRMVVDDFVGHAREICAKIREDNGLRSAPFTDTVLREMAIRFPRNQDELLQLPHINEEMVKRHSKPFLRLIQNARQMYESFQRGDAAQDDERDEWEERTVDPNHKVVVNLVSDDERAADDEYGSFPSEDEQPEEVQSAYFRHMSSDVRAFNERFGYTQPQPQQPQQQKPAPAATANVTSSKSGAGSSKSNYHARRRGSGSGRRGGSYTGGRRFPTKKNRGSNNAATRNLNNKRDNGSGAGFGGGGGGIGMMPT